MFFQGSASLRGKQAFVGVGLAPTRWRQVKEGATRGEMARRNKLNRSYLDAYGVGLAPTPTNRTGGFPPFSPQGCRASFKKIKE